MLETIAALICAHACADFLLQTGWIAHGKAARHPLPFGLHVFAVYATAALALGMLWHPMIAALTAAHFAIDLGKSYVPTCRLKAFLLDQAAHLLTIVAIAWAAPMLWHQGIWAGQTMLPGLLALAAGAILTIMAGKFAVAILLRRFATDGFTPVFHGGTARIGMIERAMIFMLILGGAALAVAIVAAVKGVYLLRQQDGRTQAGWRFSIVGTLASFGWAIALSSATLGLVAALPPIGIATLIP